MNGITRPARRIGQSSVLKNTIKIKINHIDGKKETTNLIEFGKKFDVSDNAEVLVTTATYTDGTTKVIVYRNIKFDAQKWPNAKDRDRIQ